MKRKVQLVVRAVLLCIFLITVPIHSTIAQTGTDYQDAFKLYLQVIRGEKKFEELTAKEKQQVIMIHGIMSRDNYNNEECREAREEAESAAVELETAARRLANCAGTHDFSDDCYSEFRRVKSAYDDYESAVSRVCAECD